MLIGIYIVGVITQTLVCIFQAVLDYEGCSVIASFCCGLLWPLVWSVAIIRGMVVVIRRLIADIENLWR